MSALIVAVSKFVITPGTGGIRSDLPGLPDEEVFGLVLDRPSYLYFLRFAAINVGSAAH